MASCIAFGALVFLRGSGGWLCLYRLRDGQVPDCDGRRWSELTMMERGWFYGAAIWATVAVAFGALALLLAW